MNIQLKTLDKIFGSLLLIHSLTKLLSDKPSYISSILNIVLSKVGKSLAFNKLMF